MIEPFKQAMLRREDIAKLLKIHRVTVSSWYRGRTTPHRLLKDRVALLSDVITEAIDRSQLPLDGVHHHDKFPELVAIIEPILKEKGKALDDLSQ